MTEPSNLPPCPPLPVLPLPLHHYRGTYCENTPLVPYPGRPYTVYAVKDTDDGEHIAVVEAYATAIEAVQVQNALGDQIRAVRRLMGVGAQ